MIWISIWKIGGNVGFEALFFHPCIFSHRILISLASSKCMNVFLWCWTGATWLEKYIHGLFGISGAYLGATKVLSLQNDSTVFRFWIETADFSHLVSDRNVDHFLATGNWIIEWFNDWQALRAAIHGEDFGLGAALLPQVFALKQSDRDFY
jgi:hypothetical protein